VHEKEAGSLAAIAGLVRTESTRSEQSGALHEGADLLRLDLLELLEQVLGRRAGVVLYSPVIAGSLVVEAGVHGTVFPFTALVFVFVIGTH